MTSTGMRLAGAVLALALLAAPVMAQSFDADTAAARSECRRVAARTLAGDRSHETMVVLRHCHREDVGSAVVALWEQLPPDSVSLARVVTASTGVMHRGVLEAVTRIAFDQARPPNVGAVAAAVMGNYVTGFVQVQLQRSPAHSTIYWPDIGQKVSGPDFAGLDSARAARVVAEIERLARTDPHPQVRDTAVWILRWIAVGPRRR